MRTSFAVGCVALALSLLVAGAWWLEARSIPPWTFGIVVSVAATLVFVALSHGRHDRRRSTTDALSDWRHLRAAKHVRMIAVATDRCDLVLDLVPEWDLRGEPVTMRFRGVTGLSVQQQAGLALHFDYLICDELPARGSRPRRLRVRDRWNEAVDFTCASFELVPGEAVVA